MNSSVALVLDRHFGAAIEELAEQMPVWVISSKDNNAAVERARSLLKDPSRITSLLTVSGEGERDTLLRALYDIDEHHGRSSTGRPYDQMLVYGAAPELLTPGIMKELGLEGIRVDPGRFCLQKHSAVT